MAKGDSGRSQDMINMQGPIMQGSQDATMNTLYGQNMNFNNAYNYTMPTDINNYNQGINQYQDFYNNPFGVQQPSYQPSYQQQQPISQLSYQQPQVNSDYSYKPLGGGDSIGGQSQYSGGAGGTDFDTQVMNSLHQGYPNAGQDFYDQQLNYYRGKRASDETSAWATGEPGRTMDDYWVQRAGGMGAGGADAAYAGQYAGGDASAGGYGGGGGNNPYAGLGFQMNPQMAGALSNAIGGYSQFADNGGFSDQDISDLRARATAPIRSIYGHAVEEVNRNKALQGWSPNVNSALSRMAREQSYATGDELTNMNAQIAGMRQQGRLAGLSGLTGAALGGQNAISGLTNLALQSRLGALSGMTNLYGTTPGLTTTFGNQLLNSSNQLNQGQSNQNQLGLGLIEGQNQKGAGVEGTGKQVLGNIKAGTEIAGNVGMAMAGI